MHPANTCFSLLQIHFCFMLSSLLKQPNIASFVGFVLHFIFGLLGFMTIFEKVPPSLEWIFNLFSPFTFIAGISKVCSKQSHQGSSAHSNPAAGFCQLEEYLPYVICIAIDIQLPLHPKYLVQPKFVSKKCMLVPNKHS